MADTDFRERVHAYNREYCRLRRALAREALIGTSQYQIAYHKEWSKRPEVKARHREQQRARRRAEAG
jgi:hypothetical protein